MRVLFVMLILAFVSCSEPSAVVVSDAGLQARLNSYFDAVLAENQRVVVDMMDTRFFPTSEARQEAITLLKVHRYHAITNGQTFGHFKDSNGVHCFVPYLGDTTIRGQRTKVQSYLLATRYNGDTNWFFVNIGWHERRDNLPRYYHELPEAPFERKE